MTSAGGGVPGGGSRAEEFALLVDTVEDYAIFLLSLQGEIRSWNRGAQRITGYEEREVIGKHYALFSGAPPHELDVAAREGRAEDEGWRLRKDGSRFWANTAVSRMRDGNGTHCGFGIVMRDMTERRTADAHLLHSNEIFQLLVGAVKDYAIFMLDPGGHIATWNKGAQRIKGYAPEEIIGRHFSTFYPEEDIRNRKPEIELEIAREKGSVEDEGWRLRKDGTRFWASVVITAVYDANGELRGFGKVTRDLTERKRAEEALRESKELFERLVSSVRDYAIFMLDPGGHVTTWNKGAQQIKGYKPEEIIGRHFSAFFPEEDVRNGKPQRELEVAIAEGSAEDEGWRVRKDGTRFWANAILTAVRDEQGELRGFAKVTRDITDRKAAEETQRALLEQREARLVAEEERRRAEASYRVAQEANRAKDEFLMTLSHELRTPMTAILGWARLLPTMSPSESMFREAITSIASGAQLQARLIDDLLDVSRIVSGKLRLAPETIDVGRVIMNAVDAVAQPAAAKSIEIDTALAADLGTTVADPTRLQQVIWNLLTNAVKFTPRGGRVTISARRTASQIEIEVTDTGEGIDPRFLPHIFEPFRQAESPQTRVHGGLGLGLSIVRYIAEAHGGTVSAASEGRGKGATFIVALPVRAVAAAEPVRNSFGDTFMHRDRLRGIQVVLVDDEPESRKMITAVLQAAGATVLALDSPRMAIDAIDRSLPDLVITDIAMPEIDGYAFQRMLREREYGRDLKVAALSAFPATDGRRSGFDAYLTKPVDPFHLIDEVARIAMTAKAK